jgi:hypothetical protein
MRFLPDTIIAVTLKIEGAGAGTTCWVLFVATFLGLVVVNADYDNFVRKRPA